MGDGTVSPATVLAKARGRVGQELFSFVVLVVLAGLAVAAVVSGRFPEVPGPLWWLLAGAVGMDAFNALGRLFVAVRLVRSLRRDPTLLALSVLCAEAGQARLQWVRTGVVLGRSYRRVSDPADGRGVG